MAALVLCLALMTEQQVITGTSLSTYYHSVALDHFDISNTLRFELRYLIDTTHFNRSSSAPLVVYCGNEGSIDDFAASTGVMWTLAERNQGLVAFIEERYYGKSIPKETQGER